MHNPYEMGFWKWKRWHREAHERHIAGKPARKLLPQVTERFAYEFEAAVKQRGEIAKEKAINQYHRKVAA